VGNPARAVLQVAALFVTTTQWLCMRTGASAPSKHTEIDGSAVTLKGDVMDYLQEAKNHICSGDQISDVGRATMRYVASIAAALIAQAEAMQRKPQYVRIAEKDILIDGVYMIVRHHSSVELLYRRGDSATLHDDYARAFLAWWNEHADVVRLDTGPARDAVEEAQ
jgi:hypothetical protein